jgi:hypothetical protein
MRCVQLLKHRQTVKTSDLPQLRRQQVVWLG